MRRRARGLWLVAAGCVAAAALLGAVVAVAGLERANQIAGVAGVLVGLAGLALAAYPRWIRRARHGSTDPTGDGTALGTGDPAAGTRPGAEPARGVTQVGPAAVGGDSWQIVSGGDTELRR